jgi:imidazolonepropionase-like amidohydrolase
MRTISRRAFFATMPLLGTVMAPTVRAQRPGQGEKTATLFQDVRIIDGKGGALSAVHHVLVRGSTIETISRDPIPAGPIANARIIEGKGRTLMPGLVDMHWHAMLVRPAFPALLTEDVGHLNLQAGAEAAATLLRGFTTIRDMGGPVFALKRAIDEGVLPGPRIYPSGAMITVTSGHGDFRQPFELPRDIGRPQSRGEQIGAAMIADSPDEVRVRVREQLLQGASQIKLTAGGGVALPNSPLDVATFTEPKSRPRASTAQAMRASLLAIAIASTLWCRRFLAASIQALSP